MRKSLRPLICIVGMVQDLFHIWEFVLASMAMKTSKRFSAGLVVAGLTAGVFSAIAIGQSTKVVTKQPTAADWSAAAKLPDFGGVWERGGGGGGGGGAARGATGAATPAQPAAAGAANAPAPAAAAGGARAGGGGAARGAAGGGARGGAAAGRGGGRGGGMQLTPEADAKRRAYQAVSREDNETAN